MELENFGAFNQHECARVPIRALTSLLGAPCHVAIRGAKSFPNKGLASVMQNNPASPRNGMSRAHGYLGLMRGQHRQGRSQASVEK